jgi:hypothetical protein
MKQAQRRVWTKPVGIACMTLCGLVTASYSAAQEVVLDEMQRNIEIFSGVLREGLGLNSRAGIFSPLNGSVSGTYFMEQGIVLEIVSPLASSRSSFNWQTLEGSLQQLSGQISSFVNAQAARVSPPDLEAMRESMALSLRAETARGAYAQILEGLRNVDISTEIESALASVSESARSLHQMGQIDDARLNALMAEVSDLRGRVNERIAALQALRADVNAAASNDATDTDTDTTTTVAQFQAALDQIVAAVAPVREAAASRAQELQALAEQAKREREAQWQRELVAFEENLFALVCNYSAGLRTLPEGEHLTLVLKGLGDESESRREDRIHVLSKTDMRSCLQGDQAQQQLRGSARTYSF